MSTPYDTAGWTQTFNDDFNGLSLWDGRGGTWKTSFYFGDRTLSGNGERQYYMDAAYGGDAGHPLGVDPFNTTDHPGALDITAEKAAPDVASHIYGYQYTSGLITTEPSFSQQYGYFEMRAQLPAGQGLWPAFWLLPSDKSWPPELDPLEFFGAANANGEGGATQYHLGNISSQGGWGQWVDAGADLTQGFHTFGLDWEPDTLTYYVDGRVVAQGPTSADMHKPMYMLANLAVGGNWPGAPDDSALPGHMLIDYIKAWSQDPNAVPAAVEHHDAVLPAPAASAPAAASADTLPVASAEAPAIPPPLPVVDVSQDYMLGGYGA